MSVAEGETIYFLDTSALAKLYHQEQGSEMVEGWAADHTIRLWLSDLARIELHSSFVRKVREGELAEETLQTVLECFRGDLRNRFHIVLLTEDIVERAISLLLEHGKRRPLRTLDALQIASAKAVENNGLTFVTADRQLFTVASELFPHTMFQSAPVPKDERCSLPRGYFLLRILPIIDKFQSAPVPKDERCTIPNVLSVFPQPFQSAPVPKDERCASSDPRPH